MRLAAIVVLLALFGLSEITHAQNPTSSLRSRQIIAQQRVLLERKMAEKGFGWGAYLFIRIFKAEGVLEVWLKHGGCYKRFKTYPICTYGGKGVGPKTRQGDGRAPEGFYYVTHRQMNPYSGYHLAFNLGYPNAYDRFHGRTGGALMVHGRCVSIGCYAMTNQAIEQIYTLADAALRSGQPFFRVHIFPFHMTERNIRQHRSSRWTDFWRNLKGGYDWFLTHQYFPPNVVIKKGRYSFESANGRS